MGKNTSISLSDHFVSFIETEVEKGRYGSASEVVRAGLRLLEDDQARIAALRNALDEGEASGPSTSFDFDAFIARKSSEADGSR
ncbi:MAG: type II toxin-antitoxin system ParD family antitoxin [Hyphomicrobiales bacterium]|nr:MAG: type II toxin-antitoxin system ParD family antitoxin [Hyphomicrobiales bacterium]